MNQEIKNYFEEQRKKYKGNYLFFSVNVSSNICDSLLEGKYLTESEVLEILKKGYEAKELRSVLTEIEENFIK